MRIASAWQLLLPAVLCCCCCCIGAAAGEGWRCRFPAVFNFGDSNSDTGGFWAAFRPLSASPTSAGPPDAPPTAASSSTS